MSTSPVASRWRLVVGFGLLLVALAMALTWAGWWYAKRTQADLLAALEANNRGVGHMERFEYDSAVAEFEQAVQLAPDWLPGRINLGIALLNTDRPPELERARQIFEGVLGKDADNPYAHFCLGILLKYQRDPEPAIRHFEAVLRRDPKDASAWFFLGTLLPPG